MKKSQLLIAGLVSVGLGCSQSGRAPFQSGYAANAYIPATLGSRLAAVLTKADGSCSAAQYGYGSAPMMSGSGFSSISGGADAPGRLHILSLDESEMVYVGNTSRSSNSLSGSGIRATTIRSFQNLVGLTDKSRIAYSPDASLVFAAMTSRNEIWVFPTSDKGGIRSPQVIPVGARPTKIATAVTPYGWFAAGPSVDGIWMIAIDRANVMLGTAAATSYYHAIRLDIGQPTAVRFSMDGTSLLVASNPTAAAGVAAGGGSMAICDVGTLLSEQESADDTLGRGSFSAGCYTGRGTESNARFFNGAPTNFFNPAHPLKELVLDNDLVVGLDEQLGPVILDTPNIGGMNVNSSDVLRSGYILRRSSGYGATGYSPSQQFRDIAIHPISKSILALDNTSLRTYRMDNPYEEGNSFNVLPAGTNPVSMAVDPGPDPQFLLVADKGSGHVLVGRLNALSVRGLNDFIQLPPGECPISVAIRSRSQDPATMAPTMAPMGPAGTGPRS